MARSDSRGATAAASRPLDIERELEQLEQMTVNQLRDKYAEVVGETTASRHRQWLIRRIAWRMRANVYGGLSERARELANDADLRTTPPRMRSVAPGAEERTSTRKVAFRRETRLPSIGSTIVREYKGRTLTVGVLPQGFEYEGVVYKSLSAVAKKITGSHCNGFHFFRLGSGGAES